MLKISTEVSRGIMFMRFIGDLDNNNFNEFKTEINYLLYNQGVRYFVLDFKDINLEENIFLKLQNKLVEIFLNCGEVVLCGLDKSKRNKIGYTKDKLHYVNEEREAFNYLWV